VTARFEDAQVGSLDESLYLFGELGGANEVMPTGQDERRRDDGLQFGAKIQFAEKATGPVCAIEGFRR
jgi:hypothetical protein